MTVLFTYPSHRFFNSVVAKDMHLHKTYMYINFQQNRVVNQSKPCTQIYLQKSQVGKFATTNSIFLKNRLFQACVIVKRTCISIFSKLGLANQSKLGTLIFCKKMTSCVNLQLPIVILKKSTLFDMHHHKTYMYINFQQNQVNNSVITVHTNLFAKIASCINLQLRVREIYFDNEKHDIEETFMCRSMSATNAYIKL